MPYDLISDGQQVPLGDKRYLLSPQDLAGLDVLPELVRVGVTSLKIEGRLKAPEYVASITKVYRQALDKILSSDVRENAANITESSRLSTESRYDMEMSFSRGLYTGWFGGVNNQQLVHARFGKKRGVFLGEVTRVQNEKVTLHLQAPLKLGDGVVFDAGRPDEKEEGGRIYGIKMFMGKLPGTEESVLEFGYGNIDFNRVRVGDKLWKTNDPELDKRLRQSFAGDAPRFQRPIEMEVHGLVGKPLTVIARDEEGHVIQLDSTMPLAKAEKQPLTTERLREQLGRLGGTPFNLGELKNNLSGEVMLPMSELNRLRREVATQLETLRAQPKRWTLNSLGSTGVPPVVSGVAPETVQRQATTLSSIVNPQRSSFDEIRRDAEFNPRDAGATQLIVLVRSLPQLEAALKCGVQTVYCEFEDPKKYREAVTTFHTAYGCSTA